MPLKSLELVGYKTFASKSTFVFADSITAVVGPNGSGKSNIADALRWVLGEQSYSLLRGKKTIDMIFSGSQERSPAGMASATVTFDNSDGWLPIDFSEVTITRRAYRDGQNEYLINNQKVRLRDVAELLGHSGLAERTYTIIGQGLVDAALSLKAEERRRLFEEAAGIGVYRTRRADALRRLDLTRRNLERVGDILSELRPRLRSLDRQARRVEEFEQIQADLHVLLRDWYGYHWHRGQNELLEARETARLREKDLAEVRTKKSGFDEQILNLRERIHLQRSRLTGWQSELGSLRTQRETIVRELAVARERLRSLEERRDSARRDQMSLEEEFRLQEERLERTVFEGEQLRQTADEAGKQNEELQAALAARTTERDSVQTAVIELERSLAEMETRISGRIARLETLRNRQDDLTGSLSGLERELALTGTEIEAHHSEEESFSREVLTVDVELEDLLRSAGEHGRKITGLRTELAGIRTSLREKETKAARLETQLDVLRQAEQSMAGLSDGARAVIEAGRTGRLSGIDGSLGGLIEIPAQYDSALAAALGSYFDAVVVDTAADAFAALDLLAAGNTGGALVPADPNRSPAPDRSALPDNALTVLSDLTRCPERLRPAVNRLLGTVVVTADRSAAEALLPRLPFGWRIVTLDGIVFRTDGPISISGSGRKGLIERPRRIKELGAALSHLHAENAALKDREGEMAGSLAAAEETAAAIEAVIEEKRNKSTDVRSAADRARAALEQAEARLNWHRSRAASMQKEAEDVEGQIVETEDELEALRSRVAAVRADLGREKIRLDELPLEDVQKEAGYWQTRAAVTQRAAEDALARIEDRKLAILELQRRREEIERQFVEFEGLDRILELEIEKLKVEEQQVGEQIDRIKAIIAPADKDLRDLENEQDTAQEAEAQARQALSAAERNHSQAQITLARRQEAMESLRQRIEDDFGLVSFEYADDVSGPTPLPLGSFVESLPNVISVSTELGDSIKRQRAQLRRMGAINPDAKKEFEEVRERFEFLTAQLEDLNRAETDILEAVGELDLLMEREFRKTFDEVAREFRETFTRLFGGGSARLVLTDPGDLTETGVDIEAQLPGRRLQGLSLLSGGERSLTAAALVLSLIKVSPTPFCVLDEVDAMLDEANVNRLADLLRELSARTQFIIITHNRNTVQAAETIYGITMGRDSTSQVLSLKLDEVMEIV